MGIDWWWLQRSFPLRYGWEVDGAVCDKVAVKVSGAVVL